MQPQEIKQIRLSLKMTQANFGAMLGLTGNTIARYERGESQPENPTLFALAVEQVRQQQIAAALEPEWQALLARSAQMAEELKQNVNPKQQRVRNLSDLGVEENGKVNLKKLTATTRRSLKQLQRSKTELEVLVKEQLRA